MQGESVSEGGRSCSSGNVKKSPGRAEHRLAQGTKVKRQIPFLGEFPVQIRKLGVTVQAQARPHPRWCSVVLMARSWEALTTLNAEEDFYNREKGQCLSQRGREEPG